MQTVYLSSNPLDLTQWTKHEVEDIRALLVERFPKWPETAHIYHQHVARDHDVTPRDEAGEELLGSLEGPFFVVVYPAWANVAAAVLIYVIAWVATTLLKDETPKPREHTFTNGSPNNSLSERSNQARLNQRIPDILGTVRCVPDLLMFPYIVYETHRPIEYSYMCLGRGKLAPADVRDGDTLVSQIQEASAIFYPPTEAPGGGSPSLVIGQMITDNVYNVYPVKGINHQQLAPINSTYVYGSGINTLANRGNLALKWIPMQFFYNGSLNGTIRVPTNGDPDYVTSRFRVGDEVQVIWGTVPIGLATKPDLSAGFAISPTPLVVANGVPIARGELEPLVVLSVTTVNNQLVDLEVSVPSALEFQWLRITPYSGGPGVSNKNCSIAAQNRWPVGYAAGNDPDACGIFVDDPDCEQIWMNFVASRGLYLEDGSNRRVLTETIGWRFIPCDASGTPTADPVETSFVTLSGSMIGGETRAVTAKHVRTTPGRCLMFVARTSMRIRQVDLDPTTNTYFKTQTFNLNYDLVGNGPDGDPFPETAYTGNIIDDIEFTECYSMSAPTTLSVGDVTTVHTRTVSNQSAARVVERQLNCKATRSTLAWNGAAFTTPEDLQGFGENMLFHIMKDPFIGRRQNSEIDFAGIAAAFLAVRTYFGDESATNFSYTFDDHNMSFEETVATLCQACFITPYRLGRLIKCDPDIASDNAVMLFNHRNKIPDSEQRTFTFGQVGDNDGVEQAYINIDTGHDTFTPLSLTNSQPSVVAPLQSRIVGLRTRVQAIWHAYRQQGKMTWQYVSTDFEATQEAAIIALRQRILVEDNTRPDVQDGEIIDVSAFTIRTSQPTVLTGPSTYTLFIQHVDGTVEGIPVTAGSDNRTLVLSFAPALTLVTNPDFGVPSKYMLVRDQSTTSKAFLVTSKEAQDRMTYKMSAINYSHMYYHGDGLIFWMPVSTEISTEEFFDRGPYEIPFTSSIVNLTSDVQRGPVYIGHTGDAGLAVSIVNAQALIRYTKAVWIKKTTANRAPISTSTGAGREEFLEVTAAGVLQAGHNNVVKVGLAGFTNNVWHHVALSYNSVGTSMRLYLDGEFVASSASVGTRVLTGLILFKDSVSSFEGVADQYRHYSRVLSDSMIRELYQKEFLP